MSEKAQQDVSRETNPDAPITPEQKMLNDIMDRTMPKNVDTPKEEPNQDVEAENVSRETSTSGKSSHKNKRSSVYVYLAVLFGAAFLMLLLAYFVQQRNNDAVQDDLRSITASREELLENINKLEEENTQLQADLESQTARADLAEQENTDYKQHLTILEAWYEQAAQKAQAATFLWFLDRFMDARDYPMAAAAAWYSGSSLQSLYENNPAQMEQYQEYLQELVERGYLQQLDPSIDFTDQWEPSRNMDMTAMAILWISLDAYYLNGMNQAAAQYLYLFPLGDPASGYQERLQRLASDFTLRQFQHLKDSLVKTGDLIVADDGTLTEGPGDGNSIKFDVLYGLPFELPQP